MELHHDKHHAAYVKKLNEAVKDHSKVAAMPLDEILAKLPELPDDIRTAVRNNGGGHANHSMFWQVMGRPGGGEPTGAIAEAIKTSFESFQAFKDQFSKAALDRFGSGWAWLIQRSGRLVIETTANQDSPIMQGQIPLLGLDVWEHAYYLKYQNRRADYVKAWWNVVNWAAVNQQMDRQTAGVAK